MAKKTQKSGSNLKPFYLILGVVAVLGGAAIALGAMRRGGDAAVAPVDLSSLDARALLERARGVRIGEDSAPVQVLVFSDYMCPACAFFSSRVQPLLKQTFVDDGRVQLIYYDYPLGGSHVHSFLAARAARCAETQNRFWEYHDALLTRQQDWSYSRQAPIAKFASYAGDVGLDTGQFMTCLRSDEHAELVSANHELGAQLGVNSTPSLFVNGRRVENPNDWDAVRPIIERELGN